MRLLATISLSLSTPLSLPRMMQPKKAGRWNAAQEYEGNAGSAPTIGPTAGSVHVALEVRMPFLPRAGRGQGRQSEEGVAVGAQMVNDINAKFRMATGERECWTCKRGQETPARPAGRAGPRAVDLLLTRDLGRWCRAGAFFHDVMGNATRLPNSRVHGHDVRGAAPRMKMSPRQQRHRSATDRVPTSGSLRRDDQRPFSPQGDDKRRSTTRRPELASQTPSSQCRGIRPLLIGFTHRAAEDKCVGSRSASYLPIPARGKTASRNARAVTTPTQPVSADGPRNTCWSAATAFDAPPVRDHGLGHSRA